jgi:NAD(P)-dependent dehydrogenase (short-subunit alcohol dehydrogenase family)
MGKYCIVTGANAGIGKEIAAGLMQDGSHVVMACRNMQQCELAQAELGQRQLPGTCECSRCAGPAPTQYV